MSRFARVVKGVDLKSTAERRVGSNPAGDVSFVVGVLYSVFVLHLLPFAASGYGLSLVRRSLIPKPLAATAFQGKHRQGYLQDMEESCVFIQPSGYCCIQSAASYA